MRRSVCRRLFYSESWRGCLLRLLCFLTVYIFGVALFLREQSTKALETAPISVLSPNRFNHLLNSSVFGEAVSLTAERTTKQSPILYTSTVSQSKRTPVSASQQNIISTTLHQSAASTDKNRKLIVNYGPEKVTQK